MAIRIGNIIRGMRQIEGNLIDTDIRSRLALLREDFTKAVRGGVDILTLKSARHARRITQLELARRTGIHNTRISMIENGHVVPTEQEKRDLAQALGLELWQLDF